MYYKIENYVDDDGKVITAKTPQLNTPDLAIAHPVTYVGTVPLTVRTPQGIGQIPFEFEFPPSMSLDECFAKFEEIAKQKVEEFKEEQQDRNRIVPASNVPSNIKLVK